MLCQVVDFSFIQKLNVSPLLPTQLYSTICTCGACLWKDCQKARAPRTGQVRSGKHISTPSLQVKYIIWLNYPRPITTLQTGIIWFIVVLKIFVPKISCNFFSILSQFVQKGTYIQNKNFTHGLINYRIFHNFIVCMYMVISSNYSLFTTIYIYLLLLPAVTPQSLVNSNIQLSIMVSSLPQIPHLNGSHYI